MNFRMIAAALLAGSAPVAAAAAPAKPTIVLVHGAFETSDIWGRVQVRLKHDGYEVKIVDLPGRRGNPAASGGTSLALYQKAVAAVIDKEARPVVLVGHSFGGFTISAEAEAEPERIKTLVYLAAYIPQNGQSLLTLASTDKNSKLGPILKIDKDTGYASVDPAAGGAVFASDGPPAAQNAVAAGVVSEPLPPLVAPITLTEARFGAVDKVAIHTLRDEVVSPYLQALMAKTTTLRLQLNIDTGHAPFVTQADALAIAIEKAAI